MGCWNEQGRADTSDESEAVCVLSRNADNDRLPTDDDDPPD